MRTATISGVLVGRLWMPGVVAYKHVSATVQRDRSATSFVRGGPYPSLREALEGIMTEHGGDFQECGLVPGETWLEVEESHQPVKGSWAIRQRVRKLQFACWDTEDYRASDELLAEYEGNRESED